MNEHSDQTDRRPGVHVIVPDAIDDPLRPSGGNAYDRMICDGLVSAGWRVHEHLIPDAWPRLRRSGNAALAQLLPQLPEHAVVLVDGLLAEASANVLVPAAGRVRLAVLVHAAPRHLPGDKETLAAARAVIATSGWVRDELLRSYGLCPDAVAVAVPGVDARPLATGSASGGELLCVGAVAPHKGHDVLLAALVELAHLDWRCRCLGSLDYDSRFATGLLRQADQAGIGDRLVFGGPRTGTDLETAYAESDVLVHPAREEGYGMVVAEALAHGLPVIASACHGLTDALGIAPDGDRPGLLVAAGDARALADAIAAWLADESLRATLRRAARARRKVLPTWTTTVDTIAHVLTRLG